MTSKHVTTFMITFVIWLVFFLFGLPSDYYQTWTYSAQVWLSVFAFSLLLPLTYLVLDKVWKENYLKNSLWLAFYGSVPLTIYDYVYVGLMQGAGHSYIFSHWYLSIFYLIVWVEIPFVGWLMDRRIVFRKEIAR
ncbi:MAG: hypothetical protein ACE5IY_21155 [bacterium]